MARRSILLLATGVVLLLTLGFAMLASAGYYTPEGGEEHSLVLRQLLWLAPAVLLGLACGLTDYHVLQRWKWWLLALAIITLALCYEKHVGIKVNGARRWIGLDFLIHRQARVQPSEFAKLVLILVLAAWFGKHGRDARAIVQGFLLPLCILAPVVVLIGGEMDLGSALIAAGAGLGVMIVAGTRVRYIILAGLLALRIRTADS